MAYQQSHSIIRRSFESSLFHGAKVYSIVFTWKSIVRSKNFPRYYIFHNQVSVHCRRTKSQPVARKSAYTCIKFHAYEKHARQVADVRSKELHVQLLCGIFRSERNGKSQRNALCCPSQFDSFSFSLFLSFFLFYDFIYQASIADDKINEQMKDSNERRIFFSSPSYPSFSINSQWERQSWKREN